MANATDALIHFFHGIFARVHLGIESTDILNNSEPSTTFLGNTEDGGVEGRFGLLNYSKTKPFLQRLFVIVLVLGFERKLALVNWLVILQVEMVFVGLATAKVSFGCTDDLTVFVEQLEVPSPEFVEDVGICFLQHFLICEEFGGAGWLAKKFLHFGFQLADEFLNRLIVQGYGRISVGPLVKASNELISLDRDCVRGNVGNGQLADFVFLELDQGGSPLKVSDPGGQDHDRVCGKGIKVCVVGGMDDGHRKGADGGLASGDQGVMGLGDREDLLHLGVIGHAQIVDEVDSKDVNIEVFTNHEGP